MARVVVFDLDGTLIDSAPVIGSVLDSMRSERGLPPLPIAVLRRWIALGVGHLVSNALQLPSSGDSSAVADFRARYARAPTTPAELYVGVEEALNRLAAAGVAMGVCSNKPQILCEKVLSGTGIRGFFRAVLGGDSVPHPKPHPMHVHATLDQMGCAGEDFFLVGDSDIDAEAAVAARGVFLWASYGYGDSTTLSAAPIRLRKPMDVVFQVLSSHAA